MPWTLNVHHLSHFNAFFPVQINKMWNFCLKLWFFRNHLSLETWILCHWIWHASNHKYMPLKPFWCIYSSQNQQNVKFLPQIVIFQERLIRETWNLCHWIWHASNPKIHVTQAILMHLFQSKSTKCGIFASNCDFSGTTYHRDLKPVPLDLACLKP